ncbi:MAG: hypothetical protein Q8882_07670, partial [Bacillota bacterium]|nr:hypothetical protein [Bacillota bacterium]
MFDKFKGKVNALKNKPAIKKTVDFTKGIIERPLNLQESFSCKVLEAIYDHDIYISRKSESKSFADISVFLLYTIVALSPFVPGYVSFSIIMLMFLAFMAGKRSGKIKAHRFTDFDILLCMFCF